MTEIDFNSMNMSDIFPKIDKQATCHKVANFLKWTLPRMVRIAGKSLTDLRSPNYDGMPKATASGNSTDARIVEKLYAQEVIKRTAEAMGHCDKDCREVLDMLYLQDYSDTMCYMAIGYSKSSFSHDKKPQALLQFADCYMLEDLRVKAS
ncbi:ArpU family phage packaging/lysis transcriptional regulator [Levilactobacillus enshiensis]|uniref:ArpU family phage packaging/lysis transcriptional regulator n=1 Tax=Levilactobacillus enshiensis TaxID=2590213 RepID=UPI00117A0699|nr:ArpU family phage packaging/lysis transcriptional regulator [Levilactobacillus enshiensis]